MGANAQCNIRRPCRICKEPRQVRPGRDAGGDYNDAALDGLATHKLRDWLKTRQRALDIVGPERAAACLHLDAIGASPLPILQNLAANRIALMSPKTACGASCRCDAGNDEYPRGKS
jgi:hypothetical protein